MKTISVRLPEQYPHDIEEACRPELVDRGTMFRKLVGTGLREYHIKKALELYRSGEISLWNAEGMAEMTYRGALEGLKRSNIPFQYKKEGLAVDIEWALKEGWGCREIK